MSGAYDSGVRVVDPQTVSQPPSGPAPGVRASMNDDLCTSLTIDNLRQSDVGRVLDTLRDAGFDIEVNVSPKTTATFFSAPDES